MDKGDDEEYGANGGRSYGSSFEAPSYASVEGAFDLTPEDGGNGWGEVVDYPVESDYAEDDEEEGGGNIGGIHEGGDRDSGGGGTGDSIGEKRDNLISTFKSKFGHCYFQGAANWTKQ